MYIPFAAVPPAIVAALLRSSSESAAIRALFRWTSATAAAVGLLGLSFHWTGNLRKYREKAEKDELPGAGKTEEDRKHGLPEPRTHLAGYDVGALLEVGARGRPWLAPLALTGLGAMGLLIESGD